MKTALGPTFLMDVANVITLRGLDTECFFVCENRHVPENLHDCFMWRGNPTMCVVCRQLRMTPMVMNDLLPYKRKSKNYDRLLLDMSARGQKTPIQVIGGAYINNGGHRIAVAVDLGWDTILCTENGWDASDNSLTNSWRTTARPEG
jgi:hypothetical protein